MGTSAVIKQKLVLTGIVCLLIYQVPYAMARSDGRSKPLSDQSYFQGLIGWVLTLLPTLQIQCELCDRSKCQGQEPTSCSSAQGAGTTPTEQADETSSSCSSEESFDLPTYTMEGVTYVVYSWPDDVRPCVRKRAKTRSS